MSKIKKTLMSLGLLLALTPLAAQERSDTTYTFRFVPGRDMFYSPWKGNETELMRMEACVAEWKERILKGEIPVYVEGWCSSKQTKKENLAMARIRSNRVKSELITRQGLTEECFVTRNHATEGDFVTVRIAVPKEDTTSQKDEEERLAAERAEQQRKAADASERQRLEQERIAREQQAERERVEAERLAAEQARADSLAKAQSEAGNTTVPVSPLTEKASLADSYTLALRANLLRWATLTPDLGIEWRISPSVGVLVNGSWTSWTWKNNDRRYALWEVSPEVRWYIGEKKAWHIGAMGKVGHFNYKLSETGRQGDILGGGLTGGYQLHLNDALSMDFSLSLGYLRADYEKYVVIDAVRVRDGSGSKDWWGPINAGVTLVWKLF